MYPANRSNFHGICSRRKGRKEGSCDFKRPRSLAHTAAAAAAEAAAADADNAREAKMRKNGEGAQLTSSGNDGFAMLFF